MFFRKAGLPWSGIYREQMSRYGLGSTFVCRLSISKRARIQYGSNIMDARRFYGRMKRVLCSAYAMSWRSSWHSHTTEMRKEIHPSNIYRFTSQSNLLACPLSNRGPLLTLPLRWSRWFCPPIRNSFTQTGSASTTTLLLYQRTPHAGLLKLRILHYLQTSYNYYSDLKYFRLRFDPTVVICNLFRYSTPIVLRLYALYRYFPLSRILYLSNPVY